MDDTHRLRVDGDLTSLAGAEGGRFRDLGRGPTSSLAAKTAAAL
ncbi:MAG: hypothetical protein U0235_33840 [Polyangiaceae bacterium]